MWVIIKRLRLDWTVFVQKLYRANQVPEQGGRRKRH